MDAPHARTGQDLQDASFYLQGLIQVMAADGRLHPAQREAIHAFAGQQGFDPEYVDEIVLSVLENPFFPKHPPHFHRRATAEAFLQDALRLAVCDGLLHPSEQAWLRAAASLNGLDPIQFPELATPTPTHPDPACP